MQISIDLTLAAHCTHIARMDSCCGACTACLACGVRVIDRQTNGYDQVRPKMRKGRGREGPGTEASGPDWRKWQRKTGNAKSEAAAAGSAVREQSGKVRDELGPEPGLAGAEMLLGACEKAPNAPTVPEEKEGKDGREEEKRLFRVWLSVRRARQRCQRGAL